MWTVSSTGSIVSMNPVQGTAEAQVSDFLSLNGPFDCMGEKSKLGQCLATAAHFRFTCHQVRAFLSIGRTRWTDPLPSRFGSEPSQEPGTDVQKNCVRDVNSLPIMTIEPGRADPVQRGLCRALFGGVHGRKGQRGFGGLQRRRERMYPRIQGEWISYLESWRNWDCGRSAEDGAVFAGNTTIWRLRWRWEYRE